VTQYSDRPGAAAGYGDAFADVYDAWYSDDASQHSSRDTSDNASHHVAGDVAGIVALSRRFDSGDVLELGAGTGRLTLPLARAVAPRRVVAVDASPAMLDRLRTKLGTVDDARPLDTIETGSSKTDNVTIAIGDMSSDAVPRGPFSLVVVSYNTLFNLPDEGAQRRCFATIAERLTDDGACVIDCFVPVDDPAPLGVSRDVRNGSRVITATYTDARHRVVSGITEEHRASGTVLRPWRVVYASPALLDDMAAAANLRLVERRGGWNGETFGESSSRHVSIYARAHRTLTA
jgi:SAM-dependent methyltransferase